MLACHANANISRGGEWRSRLKYGRVTGNHIRGRQLEFLGHVMRQEALENLAITGKIEGRRSRGRQREKFINGMIREIGGGITAGRLFHLARDRSVWSSMVANVYRGMAHR